jgi:hypothetical protein
MRRDLKRAIDVHFHDASILSIKIVDKRNKHPSLPPTVKNPFKHCVCMQAQVLSA